MLARRMLNIGKSLTILTRILNRNMCSTQHSSESGLFWNKDAPFFHKFDDGYITRGLRREELETIRVGAVSDLGAYITAKEANILWECADPVPGAHFYAGEAEGQLASAIVFYKVGPAIYACGGAYTNPNLRAKHYWKRLHQWIINTNPAVDLLTDIQPQYLLKSFKSLGWKHVFNTLAWEGHSPSLDRFPDGVVQGSAIPLEKLVQYDATRFIYPKSPVRKRLFQRWCDTDGYMVLVAVNAQQDITGFAVRRPATEDNFAIGPWYADNIEVAERLLQGLLYNVPQEVKFHVENWDPNADAQKLLKSYNFKNHDTYLFVKYGEKYEVYKPWIYGITSVDFCPC